MHNHLWAWWKTYTCISFFYNHQAIEAMILMAVKNSTLITLSNGFLVIFCYAILIHLSNYCWTLVDFNDTKTLLTCLRNLDKRIRLFYCKIKIEEEKGFEYLIWEKWKSVKNKIKDLNPQKKDLNPRKKDLNPFIKS